MKILAVVVVAVVLSGCGSGAPGAVASITVAPSTSSILVGGTQQFSGAARDSAGNVVSNVPLIWATSSVSMATVDSTGLVTALKLGSVSITASANGISSPPVSLIIEPKPGVPAATTGLSATVELRAVRLSWNPNPSSGVTSYSVYRSSSTWTTWTADLPAAGTEANVPCCSYLFSGLDVGTEYSFAVSATNAIGEGTQSAQVKARPSAVAVAWTTRASMPTARFDLGVAVVAGKIYAIGGDSGSLLNTVEIYDPATNSWTTGAPMPTPRARLAVAAVNGKIYAMGGQSSLDGNQRLSRNTEAYDPATNQWVARALMPSAPYQTCGDTAGAAVNGKIYVWPGSCSAPPPATLFEYDPATDVWVTRSTVPFQNLTNGQMMTTLADRIWAISPSQGGQEGALIAQYDHTLDTWSIKPSVRELQQLGNSPSLSVLGASAQTLYVFGYQDRAGNREYAPVARYFDSAAGNWPTTNPLSAARDRFATVTVGTQLFAIGGALPVGSFGGIAVPVATVEVGVESR